MSVAIDVHNAGQQSGKWVDVVIEFEWNIELWESIT